MSDDFASTPVMPSLKDAMTDPQQIKTWSKHRTVSIGLPTGAVSGVDVLEVYDLAALRALVSGREITTLSATIGVGGVQFYFQHVEGVTTSSGALPAGIYVHGDIGYVLLPPSFHPGSGRRYAWANDAAVAPWPDWLLEIVLAPKPERAMVGDR